MYRKEITAIIDNAVLALNDFICTSSKDIVEYEELGKHAFDPENGFFNCRTHSTMHVFDTYKARDITTDAIATAHGLITTYVDHNIISEPLRQAARTFTEELAQSKFNIIFTVSKMLSNECSITLEGTETAKLAALHRTQVKAEQRGEIYVPPQPKKAKKKPVAPTTVAKTSKRRSRYKDRLGLPSGSAEIHHNEIDEQMMLEFYTCYRKTSHITENHAWAEAKRNHKNELAYINVYICVHCTGYHVGHLASTQGDRRTLHNAKKYWKTHPTDANTFSTEKRLI